MKIPDQRCNCKSFQNMTPQEWTSACYQSSLVQKLLPAYTEQVTLRLPCSHRLHSRTEWGRRGANTSGVGKLRVSPATTKGAEPTSTMGVYSRAARGPEEAGGEGEQEGWKVKTCHELLCTALCAAWNITGTRHGYWGNTRAESSLPGVDWPLPDYPWVHSDSDACHKCCHRPRQEQSQQSVSTMTQTHQPGAKGHRHDYLALLWKGGSQTCLKIKKKFLKCLFKKQNQTKQILLPQPRPTKL